MAPHGSCTSGPHGTSSITGWEQEGAGWTTIFFTTQNFSEEMDKAIDTTAKALASLSHHVGSNKDQGPSRGFQTLIKMIGEAKTKHVSWEARGVGYDI